MLEKIDENLYKMIMNEEIYEDKEYILKEITSFESYFDICFGDHDFFVENISKMVTLYLRSKELFEMFFADRDLDDYKDLMPCDLRELYNESKNNIENNIIDLKEELEEIVLLIYAAIEMLEQRVVEIEKRDEVEISNDIYSSIVLALKTKFGLESTRESTIGRASKKLGETDLYIYKSSNEKREDYMIVENKIIINFKEQYKQLLGYLNRNFKAGITISINKNMKLSKALEKIKTDLMELKEEEKDFQIVSIENPIKAYPYVTVSTHILPEDANIKMKIYHLILNLHDKERKAIAKSAR